jgi:hypothetical protein
MAVMLMPAFGTTGMGLAWANDYITSRLDKGLEAIGGSADSTVGDLMHTAVKQGLWDTLFEGLTGEEIDLASRLAPITLFQDVYRNIEGAQSPFMTAAGPSGDITGKMVDSVFAIASEVRHGSSVSVTNDIVRSLRNFSGLDNIAKAHGMMQNGMYRGRTGTQLPFEMDTGDAIMQLMGFSPRELSAWYAEKQISYSHSRDVKDFSKEMQTDWVTAMEVFKEKPDIGRNLMSVINHKIILSGFSYSDIKAIQGSLSVTMSETLYRMIRDAYARGDPYHAEQLEKTFTYLGTGE